MCTMIYAVLIYVFSLSLITLSACFPRSISDTGKDLLIILLKRGRDRTETEPQRCLKLWRLALIRLYYQLLPKWKAYMNINLHLRLHLKKKSDYSLLGNMEILNWMQLIKQRTVTPFYLHPIALISPCYNLIALIFALPSDATSVSLYSTLYVVSTPLAVH